MIFAICGKKRSGKDTLANIMKDKLGDVGTIAFADAVKHYCAISTCSHGITLDMYYTKPGERDHRDDPINFTLDEISGIFNNALLAMRKDGYCCYYNWNIHDTIYKYHDKYKTWSIRRIMQVFGTDIVCKCIDDTMWCRITEESIQKSAHKHMIITDVRFDHEVKYFADMVKFIEIKMVGAPVTKVDNHLSEQGVVWPSFVDVYHINNVYKDVHGLGTQAMQLLKKYNLVGCEKTLAFNQNSYTMLNCNYTYNPLRK